MPASTKAHLEPDGLASLPVRPAVREALRLAQTQLGERYGARLQRLVLFGSQARGEAREGSDVDVLVVLRDPVNKHTELGRVSEVGWQLIMETGELVGFAVAGASQYAEASTPLMHTIRREGIEL